MGPCIQSEKQKAESDIREARAPLSPARNVMDAERTTGEKAKEKFVDSLAPVQSVLDDIGGVKKVIDPSTGYTNFKTKYNPDGSVELEGSTDLVAAKDKANRRIEHEMRDLRRKVGDAYAKAASGENMGRWGNGLEWAPRMTGWMSE